LPNNSPPEISHPRAADRQLVGISHVIVNGFSACNVMSPLTAPFAGTLMAADAGQTHPRWPAHCSFRQAPR